MKKGWFYYESSIIDVMHILSLFYPPLLRLNCTKDFVMSLPNPRPLKCYVIYRSPSFCEGFVEYSSTVFFSDWRIERRQAETVHLQRRLWAGSESVRRSGTFWNQALNRHGHRRVFHHMLLLRTNRKWENAHPYRSTISGKLKMTSLPFFHSSWKPVAMSSTKFS